MLGNSQNIAVVSVDDLLILVETAVANALSVQKQVMPEPSADTTLIDRSELVRRLGVTEQTIIRLEKKRKIPSYRIGDAARYDWEAVKKALLYKIGK